MRVLLDTHAFLWWNTDDPRLSAAARQCIAATDNEIFLSAASAWEIAIKAARGRLLLPEPPDRYVASRLVLHRFQTLPVQASHALQTYYLPALHQDPFDRLLVAQAQLEGVPLLTADPAITQYDVPIVW
jgi:PIN domain nuclease of toxin-antitoxin system